MLEALQQFMNFDAALIGVFAGVSYLTVQTLKSSIPFVGRHAMIFVLGMTLFFSTMIVFEYVKVLGISILTFLMMTSAIGIYESKKKGDIVLPNYSDDK